MDFKDLLEALKAKGLDITEEVAKLVIVELFDFAEKYVRSTENKYDDLALAVLPTAKQLLLDLADKIDGETDEETTPAA